MYFIVGLNIPALPLFFSFRFALTVNESKFFFKSTASEGGWRREDAELPDLLVAFYFYFLPGRLQWSSSLQEQRPRTLRARGINYVVIYLLLLDLRGSLESGAAAPLSF